MKDLNFSLKQLCRRCKEGSHATQADRLQLLQQVANQLHIMGFELPSAGSLKPKHVDALVTRWRAEGLAAGTVKNRLAALRWWAEKVDKRGVVKTNEDYGIPGRSAWTGDRARDLEDDALAKVACPYIRMSLQLQAAFGLRREEALKFRPGWADQGDHLRLQGSWCKGGRARVVPIVSAEQREVLDAAHRLAGGGSLIPPDRSYVRHLQVYKYATLQAGIANPHGLRHAYARRRFESLVEAFSGVGGADPTTPDQNARQRASLQARQAVARELGHERIEVTAVYLGPAA